MERTLLPAGLRRRNCRFTNRIFFLFNNNNILYRFVNVCRDTHESIANSTELHGPDGRPYTHVAADQISEPAKSTFG